MTRTRTGTTSVAIWRPGCLRALQLGVGLRLQHEVGKKVVEAVDERLRTAA